MSEYFRHRGRLNALQRYRRADDPDVEAARLDLRAERLAEHVKIIVDQAPPLTREQLDRIAALLRPSAPSDDGGAAA